MTFDDVEAQEWLTEDERAIFCRADSREAMRSLAYARLLLKRQVSPRIASAVPTSGGPEKYRRITQQDVIATTCPVCSWGIICNPGVSYHGMAHFNGGGTYHVGRVDATVKRLERADAETYLFNVKMQQALEEVNGAPVTMENVDMNLIRERGYRIDVKFGPETGLHLGLHDEDRDIMETSKLIDQMAEQVKP